MDISKDYKKSKVINDDGLNEDQFIIEIILMIPFDF